MVAHNKATAKMTLRTIGHSLGRFMAILAIIALGAGFFAGLSVSTKAMVETADEFYRRHSFYDFRLLSTLGFTDSDVAAIGETDGVSCAEGSAFRDVICSFGDEALMVLKAHMLTDNLNTLELAAGRLPEKADECVLDYYCFKDEYLGRTVRLSAENDGDTLDFFNSDEYTVVGLAYSPLYLNYERGTTTLGSGSVAGFVYIPASGLDVEYYSEIFVKLSGTPVIYSDEYNDMADSLESVVTAAVEQRADVRFSDIRNDAWVSVLDAKGELAAGWADYRQERAEAEAELAEAKQELLDARADLDSGWGEYYNGVDTLRDEVEKATQELDDAEAELADAHAELENGEAEYADALAGLENGEAEYADGLTEYNDGLAKYEDGLSEYEDGHAEYADGLAKYEDGKAQLDDASDALSSARDQLSAAEAQLNAAEDVYTAVSTFYVTAVGLDIDVAALSADAALVGAADGYLAQYNMTTAELLYALSVGPTNATYVGYYAELLTFLGENGYSSAASGLPATLSALGAADTALGSYTSAYNGSTGVEGFLTDWTYYSALLDGALDGLAGPGDWDLNAGNIAALRGGIDAGWKQYDDGYAQYRAGRSEYNAAKRELAEAKAQLDEAKQELDEAKQELDNAKAELDDALTGLNNARVELDDGWAELADARTELDDGWSEYDDGVIELADGRETLEKEKADGEAELYSAYAELRDGETEYADGVAEYEDGLKDFQQEIADAETELTDAEAEISDAIVEIDDIEPATVYVLGRSSNIGYTCFKSDAEIVAGVAKVFPFFFFLVAALICITTMTRMVSEERTQIGVMKALGYSSWTISRKYVIYAGSASLLGCLIGLWGGSWLFPSVLWKVYNIMYGFSDIVFLFDWGFSIVLGAVYILGSMAVTWYCCRDELRETPAALIRPKSPKAGKRVFLERIPFIWKRLPFLQKVSVRNILRYRQRLLMMVLGIGGCTALLLTGFGLNDSISNFISYQFDEISLYDCSVVFDDDIGAEAREEFLQECGDDVSDAVFLHSGSVVVDMDGLTKAANLAACDEPLDGFVDFHLDGAAVEYPADGECIVNLKLSEIYGLDVGDEITFRDSDMNYCTLTISGFFENYIYNYIYTTIASLSDWGGGRDVNSAYLSIPNDADHYAVAADVSAASGVANLSLTADMRGRVSGMMSSMVYIVLLIVVCAGALALIVLYNLTNININERTREIATLKVQGFNAAETAAYVFRENMILSIVGALVGLPVGKLLHMYVMSQIQIDLMSFDVRVKLTSYLLSVGLTLVFAAIVNFFMYFRLERIDMAESLKSVE